MSGCSCGAEDCRHCHPEAWRMRDGFWIYAGDEGAQCPNCGADMSIENQPRECTQCGNEMCVECYGICNECKEEDG